MRNSTMEYKVNQAYEELKRLIQWHPDSEEKFLQKMVCLLLPGQRKCWTEAIRDLRQSIEAEQGMIFVEKYVSAKYSCGFSNLLDSSIIVNER